MKFIIVLLAFCCIAWKDPIGDMNKRIEELEPLQQKDQAYLNQLQQETQNVTLRIIRRQAIIDECKRWLQPENIFKDAEIIEEKQDEITADAIPVIFN